MLISMHMQNLVKIHPLVLKLLSRNEILTSIKGHNSVINLQKLTHNNTNLHVDLVNINAFAKFGQIRHKILASFKVHNSVINQQKLTHNNPNLDLVNINAHAKLGQIPSILSQDIELKLNSF